MWPPQAGLDKRATDLLRENAMTSISRFATAALILLISTSTIAADLTRPSAEKRQAALFTVINATFDSVSGIAMAPANSAAFEDVALGESLQGGVTSATVRPPAGGCVRDIRVTFRGGRSQVIPAIDICKSHVLRLGARQ